MKRVEMFFLTLLAIASTACDKDEDPYVETPEERYEVVGITYEKRAGDQVTCHEVSFPVRRAINDTDIPAKGTISFSQDMTSSSVFAENQGLKVLLNDKSMVGIPVFVNGDMKSETLSDEKWIYSTTKKELKTSKVEKTVICDYPPKTTINVTLLAMQYDANLTYIINLRSLATGKILTLQGKWKGEVIQEEKIIVENGDGTLIETIYLNP